MFLDPEQAARAEPRGRALLDRRPAEPVPLTARSARHLPGRGRPKRVATWPRHVAEGIYTPGQHRRRRRRSTTQRHPAPSGRSGSQSRPHRDLPRRSPGDRRHGRGSGSRWPGRSSSSTTTSRSKLGAFGRPFGAYDFSAYDLDAPFPDVGDLGDEQPRRLGAAGHTKVAREEKLTLRQTVERFSQFKPSPFVGSPQTVADTIERWFDRGRVRRAEPRRSGPPRTSTPSSTGRAAAAGQGASSAPSTRHRHLRGNLGLPIPDNRYTAARRAAEAGKASADDRTPVLQGVS